MSHTTLTTLTQTSTHPLTHSHTGRVAVSALCTVVDKMCVYFRPPAGPAMDKPALTAVKWSCIAARHSEEINDITITSQVYVKENRLHHHHIMGYAAVLYIEAQFYSQAVLLSATLAHDPKRSSRVWQVARRQLLSLWLSKAGLASHSLSRLLSAEETLPALSLLSLLAEHCQQTGHLDNTLQV